MYASRILTKMTHIEENQTASKLSKTKDVIAYLAAKFPACFYAEGDAKPLKIGVFDDLAARLDDDETVSKTRLRIALRHYTNSWRYLRTVKAGVERVDLDGKPAGIVEEQHQQHAEETLAASKAAAAERAAAKRKAEADKKPRSRAPKAAPANAARQARAKRPARKPAAASVSTNANNTAKAAQPQLAATTVAALKVGQAVHVKAGVAPIPGSITELDKNDVHVQLQNGLTVKVNVAAVFVAKQE